MPWPGANRRQETEGLSENGMIPRGTAFDSQAIMAAAFTPDNYIIATNVRVSCNVLDYIVAPCPLQPGYVREVSKV